MKKSKKHQCCAQLKLDDKSIVFCLKNKGHKGKHRGGMKNEHIWEDNKNIKI